MGGALFLLKTNKCVSESIALSRTCPTRGSSPPHPIFHPYRVLPRWGSILCYFCCIRITAGTNAGFWQREKSCSGRMALSASGQLLYFVRLCTGWFPESAAAVSQFCSSKFLNLSGRSRISRFLSLVAVWYLMGSAGFVIISFAAGDVGVQLPARLQNHISSERPESWGH